MCIEASKYKLCLSIAHACSHTSFKLNSSPEEESIMSKGQDSKKSTKKEPLLTPKEKKAAKAAKKAKG